MSLAEMCAGALTPRSYEPVIQSCSDRRTRQRDHAPRPLLNDLSAGLRGDPLDDAGYEFIDQLLFPATRG